MLLEYAKPIAQELVGYLRKGCIRCEIAGSIRRGKEQVKDIEIVAMPDMEPFVWGNEHLLDKLLNDLEQQEKIIRVKGKSKYRKYAVYFTNPITKWLETISLDLFIVRPPAHWGGIFTIRTGPGNKENNFSRWIVTQRRKGGCLPDEAEVHDGGVYVNGELIGMPEETDFLRYLELGWIEPGKRAAKWRRYG